MNYEKIGEFIAEKRKEKNLTQVELAKKLGVTDKAVSKWERGLGCPDVSILEILSKELDVSILELLKGRKIENEVIKITEADDYIKDSFQVSDKINREKNIRNYNIIISILIICISSFLFLTNLRHYFDVSKEEYIQASDETIEAYDKFVSNMGRIEELKDKLSKEDYEIFKNSMDKTYEYYKNDEFIRLNETLNMSEFWVLFDNHFVDTPAMVPQIVRIYSEKSTAFKNLHDQFISSKMILLTAGRAFDNFYNSYFFKPLNASYAVSGSAWELDSDMTMIHKYTTWGDRQYLNAVNNLFDVLFEGGVISE